MYEKLSKIYYKENSQFYQDEYHKRQSSYGTMKIPLRIKPMKSSEEYQCFYVNHSALMALFEKLFKNSKDIQEQFSKLPDPAIQKFIVSKLKEELVSTNEIEGVRSSRKQMTEVLESQHISTTKKLRFESLVNSYAHLMAYNTTKVIAIPEDVRELYDELVADEVKGNNVLDGKLFRLDGVEVLSPTGSQKVIHVGIYPEEKIKSKLSELLYFLNDFQAPMLFKIAISHFYFGYIHPFYDGNGRVSRYFSSLYIKKELDTLTSLTLSYATNKMKQLYYEAFQDANNPLNKGELTFFVETFFKILDHAQENILSELSLNVASMEKLEFLLEAKSDELTAGELQLLYIVGQATIFGFSDEGIYQRELQSLDNLIIPKTNIPKSLKKLEQLESISYTKRNPVCVALSEALIERLYE